MADYWWWIGGSFAVGSGGDSETPVIFEDEALGLDFAVGRYRTAIPDNDADVTVGGAVLLGDDVAGLGLFSRKGYGPAPDLDEGIGPLVGAGIARNETEMSGNAGTGMAGRDDPVGDGLIAFIAAGAVPTIPFGGEVGGVAEMSEGDFRQGAWSWPMVRG